MRFLVQVFAVVVLGYQQFTDFGVSGIQDCRTTLDIVMIVDSSLSVGLRNFRNVTAFVQNLVRYLPVESDGIRVSVVRYATDATVVSYLDKDTSKDEKLAAIQKMRYKIGSTYTHVALQLTRKSVLVPERGDRPDVPNLIILMTDGASNKPNHTLLEADILKENEDNKIFVIGIGKDVADNELVAVASRPEMVYKLTNFSQLADIVGRLARFSCSDMDEDSISHLGNWSDPNFFSPDQTNYALPVSTSTRQPPTTVHPRSTSPTTTLSQVVVSQVVVSQVSLHPPYSLTNQTNLGQQSTNATVSSKSELTNSEITLSSPFININKVNQTTASSLVNTTDQHTSNTRNIPHSGATLATQRHSNTEVVQDQTEIEFTKEIIVTAQGNTITSSNHVLNSNLTTLNMDLKLSTNILTLSRSPATESPSIHHKGNQSYNQTKSTILLMPTTATINQTPTESTRVFNSNTIKPYFATTSTPIDGLSNLNTTIDIASNRVVAATQIGTQASTEPDGPNPSIANTRITNYTSSTADVTVVKLLTSTINTTTPIRHVYPILVTNNSIDRNYETVYHHTTNTINETEDQHTSSLTSEIVDQLTPVSDRKISYPTQSGISETAYLFRQSTTVAVPKLRAPDDQSSTMATPTSRPLDDSTSNLAAHTSRVPADQSTTLVAPTSRLPDDQSSTIGTPTSRLPDDTSSTLVATISRVPFDQSSIVSGPSTRTSTDQSLTVTPHTSQLDSQTTAGMPLITQEPINQTSPRTSTSNKRNQTKHTQSIKRHSTKRTHRTSTMSRFAPTATGPTRSHSTGKYRVSSTTVVVEYKTLTRDSEIDIEIIETKESDYNPGQTGGDISSRDLYIFVAGGSAAAIILLAVGTFLAVLYRRRNVSSGEDVDI